MDTSQSSSCGQKCASNGLPAPSAAVAEDPDKPPGRRPLSNTSNHLRNRTRNRARNRHSATPKQFPPKETIEFSVATQQPKQQQPIPANADPSPRSSKSSATFSLAKAALLLLTQLPLRAALPVSHILQSRAEAKYHKETESELVVNMALSALLVLLGGVFAGLTLGLMGQDEVYLQVIQQSGGASERKAAAKVLRLLKKGKHWVLVTLLLSNVITNESLPIVLDRCLGGGWPAIVSSTVAIVIFGEIIPQSVSVRYGLTIGATFSPFVLGLMYLMYPVAYPIAMLLDYILGEDHGTMYNRAGLRTLVTLHKTMGVERLNDDEVTIISAVLDLKDKPVDLVMTPMEDVFTMSSDRVLDEATIEEILQTGFNRIPVHAPNEPSNFVGMLLVRTLITYDPEDAFPISSFPLATLPETKPDTSCLNILNYFQEGKSHMIVVSQTPGAPTGALGVLTLEDVIEELIGEEIIDESDVYVDVHRAIKREHPNNQMKRIALSTFTPRSSINFESAYHALVAQSPEGIKPKLNPLNKASNPKATTNTKVTIKPALGNTLEVPVAPAYGRSSVDNSDPRYVSPTVHRSESDAVRAAAALTSPDDASAAGAQRDRLSASPEQSHRSGGIIESVVTVQGVNKTIIEVEMQPKSSDNGPPSSGSSSSGSTRWGRRRSDDEEDPLLDGN